MNNEINSNIKKGTDLLNEAISNYESGNSTKAYNLYQKAGKFLSEAFERSNTEEGKMSMIYGGNRNFGAAYKVFESNTVNLLKSNPKSLKRIMNLIKENKVLSGEFALYNALTNPTNVKDAKEYVSEAVNLISHTSKKDVMENNEKLINLMRECKLDENVTISSDEKELFENIEYMILNPKSLNNINEYNRIQNMLCEYVEDNNNVINESVNIDKVYDSKIDEIASKYENELNEDEIKLIRVVNENPKKAKKIFDECKSSVISLVRENIEKGVNAEAWNEILEKVNGKIYENETALTNIAELIDIKNQIEG